MKPDGVSPAAVLEVLEFRFGAFLAIAHAALELAEMDADPEFWPPMDRSTAWAIIQFGRDLRQASEAVGEWTQSSVSGR